MKQIIAKQEYTDKYVSLYEGQIRNIANNLADRLIEKGIVAEHDEDEGGGNSNTGILLITDDDIVACADENNNVKWSDVLDYAIRKKIGIIPSNIAPKEYMICFSKQYPALLLTTTRSVKGYYLLEVYFRGKDTSARVGYTVIHTKYGFYEAITDETQSTGTFTINNITYNFIKLKGDQYKYDCTKT